MKIKVYLEKWIKIKFWGICCQSGCKNESNMYWNVENGEYACLSCIKNNNLKYSNKNYEREEKSK